MENKIVYYKEMFKKYSDVVTPLQLQSMLQLGRNSTYKLLKNHEIYSKKIGKQYFIPKLSVIEYLLKK